jgi:hypothetical protein
VKKAASDQIGNDLVREAVRELSAIVIPAEPHQLADL